VDAVGVGVDPVLLPGDGDEDVPVGVDVGVPVRVPAALEELEEPDGAREGGGAGGGEVDAVGVGVRGVDRAGELADAGRIRK
jgi:hypothetical protein